MLFQEKELTMYEIRMLLKVPHSTLHGVIKLLLRDDSIKIVRTEPFRTAEPKKYYDITFRGVVYLLKPWPVDEQNRVDRNFAMKRLLEKDYLHPILKEIKNMKIDKTPNIAGLLLFESGMLLQYFSPGHPEDVQELTVEQLTNTVVNLLVAYVFRNELPELNDTEKGWSTIFSEYLEMSENPPPKQEIDALLCSNPWLKLRMKELLDSNLKRLEHSYVTFADVYRKHKDFFS